MSIRFGCRSCTWPTVETDICDGPSKFRCRQPEPQSVFLTKIDILQYKTLIYSLFVQACFKGMAGTMNDEAQYKSKTEKKKEAETLQRLGLELTRLPISKLKRITIPEELRTALIEGKQITSNIAGRRHRQFIGVLMRDIDPELIRLALQQAEDEALPEPETTQKVQCWIERLSSGEPSEIETLLVEFPGFERQRLRQLIRNLIKNKSSVKAKKNLEQLLMTQIK